MVETLTVRIRVDHDLRCALERWPCHSRHRCVVCRTSRRRTRTINHNLTHTVPRAVHIPQLILTVHLQSKQPTSSRINVRHTTTCSLLEHQHAACTVLTNVHVLGVHMQARRPVDTRREHIL